MVWTKDTEIPSPNRMLGVRTGRVAMKVWGAPASERVGKERKSVWGGCDMDMLTR